MGWAGCPIPKARGPKLVGNGFMPEVYWIKNEFYQEKYMLKNQKIVIVFRHCFTKCVNENTEGLAIYSWTLFSNMTKN